MKRQGACKPGSVLRTVSRGTGPARAAIHLSGRLLARSSSQPGRSQDETSLPCSEERGAPPLFGLAPGGVCHAETVASPPVRSYRTLSPLPDKSGGLLSVALSLWLPTAGVTRHPYFVEPGLSSSYLAAARPPDNSAYKTGAGFRKPGACTCFEFKTKLRRRRQYSRAFHRVRE